MNEAVSLTIVEILYLVLIVSISTLTIYLAVTLSKANDVLRDLKKVSGMMAGVASGVDEVKEKAVKTISAAADALMERWAKKGKKVDRWSSKGNKGSKVDVDEE